MADIPFPPPPETLNRELKCYLEDDDTWGKILRHPLVYAIPYFPALNAQHNAMLKRKKALLIDAVKDHDWHSYIFIHERPYRLMALIDVMDEMTDAEYWSALGQAWIDSENIPRSKTTWGRLLSAFRDDKHAIMNDDERDELAAMPDEFVIYQGHTSARDDGWSWTIDADKAVWFANRFVNLESHSSPVPIEPMVSTATIAKSDVLAYFDRRGESEILINPDRLKSKTTTDLTKFKRTSSQGASS